MPGKTKEPSLNSLSYLILRFSLQLQQAFSNLEG